MREARGRILVIDDEQGIRDGCRRVLEPEGYRVESAATLAEGRRQVEAGGFDMVLLDVMMPDGKGIELLEDIRRRDPQAVVAIITGYATVELAVEALKAGAYDFIAKPFSGDVLQLTVERGLERRRLLAEGRRLRQAERRAEEAARERDQMEQLDRFKSAFMLMVAHELRAPVAAAQSLLRSLLHGAGEAMDQGQREILRRIEARHGELLELINDLLALSAAKAVEPEQALAPVELGPLLRKVTGQFEPLAEQGGVALSLEPPADGLRVRADEDGLRMVFSNLIGNAVKYTRAGGRVRVRAARKRDQVEVSVADSGIGIPADDVARLGEEFFRAGNAKASGAGGTGLGLAIVRRHVERFGGRLDIQSKVGRGSTFTVILPVKT